MPSTPSARPKRATRPPTMRCVQPYEIGTKVKGKGRTGEITKVHSQWEHSNTECRYTYDVKFSNGNLEAMDHYQVAGLIVELRKRSKPNTRTASQNKKRKTVGKIVRVKNNRKSNTQVSPQQETRREKSKDSSDKENIEVLPESDEDDTMVDIPDDTSDDEDEDHKLCIANGQLTAPVANLRNQVSDLEAKNAVLSDKLEDCLQAQHEMAVAKRTAEKRLQEHTLNNVMIMAENITLRANEAVNLDLFSQLNEEKKMSLACFSDLASSLQETEAAIAAKSEAQANLATKTRELEIVANQVDSKTDELNERSHEVEKLAEAQENLVAELDQAKRKCASLSKQLETFQGRHEAQAVEHRTILVENKSLYAANQDLAARLDQRKKSHQEMRETFRSVYQEWERLSTKVQSAEAACRREQAKALILLKDKKAADHRAADAQVEAEILRQTVKVHETRVRELEAKLDQCLKPVTTLDENMEKDSKPEALESNLLENRVMTTQDGPTYMASNDGPRHDMPDNESIVMKEMNWDKKLPKEKID